MDVYKFSLLATCVSVDLARALALASLILCSVWAGANYENFLGRPSIVDNPLAWHAVFMTAGLFFATTIGISSEYLPWEFTIWNERPFRIVLQISLAILRIVVLLMSCLGIATAKRFSDISSESHATSLHSWLGILAVACLYYYILCGLFQLIYRYCKRSMRFEIALPENSLLHNLSLIRHFHNTFLMLVFLLAVTSAIATGVADFLLSSGQCSQTPATSYQTWGVGCRIGNGLCVTVYFTTVFVIAGAAFNRSIVRIVTDKFSHRQITHEASDNEEAVSTQPATKMISMLAAEDLIEADSDEEVKV